MKVETAISTYKDILDLQKKLVEMMVQQGLIQNLQENNQSEEVSKVQKNIIEGTKVSIYA